MAMLLYLIMLLKFDKVELKPIYMSEKKKIS